MNASSEPARLNRAGKDETTHAYVSRVNFKMKNKCKGSGFSNEHTVKRGKYDVYNLHATLSLVAK